MTSPAPDTGRTAEENEMREAMIGAGAYALALISANSPWKSAEPKQEWQRFSYSSAEAAAEAWSKGSLERARAAVVIDALLSGPLAPILQEAAHLRAENGNLRDRVREAEKGRPPVVEFHQQDWIPGFAAFLPGATTPQPDSRAFCVLNLGSMLSTVANGDVPASDLPGFVVESMIHEVGHVLEQWAGVEFSEERVEALCDRYRATINSEQEAGDHEPR